MPLHTIGWSLHGNFNRKTLRKTVIENFLKETPGQGNEEHTSQYIYYVETLKNGKRIFLTRPAVLNKGFDFLIHLEDAKFRHVSKKKKRVYYNGVPSMDIGQPYEVSKISDP